MVAGRDAPRAARRSRGSGRSGRRPARWRAARRRGTGRPLVPQCPRGCQRRVESGTSESSYRHDPSTVPSSPTRNVLRRGTPSIQRHTRAAPKFRERAVPMERSGTSASSTSFQARCDQCESRETPKTRTPARSNSGRRITQEAQLLGSGRRPVEEVEGEQDRPLFEQLLELHLGAGVEPEHGPNLLAVRPRSRWAAPPRDRREGARAELGGDVRDCPDAWAGRSRVKTSWSASAHPTTRQRPSGERVAPEVSRRDSGASRSSTAPVSASMIRTSRRGSRTRAGGRGLTATRAPIGGLASSRWSPMPSLPTTRNAQEKCAIRVSVLVPPQRGRRIPVARATSAPSRRASRAAGCSPASRRRSGRRATTTPRGTVPAAASEPSCSTTHAPESADHEQPTRSREEERRRALLDTDDLADLVQDRAAGRAEQPCEHDERRGRRERLPRTAARLRLALRERRRDDRPCACARRARSGARSAQALSHSDSRASSPRRRRELTVPRGTPRSSAISPGVYSSR